MCLGVHLLSSFQPEFLVISPQSPSCILNAPTLIVYELVIVIFKKYTQTPLYAVFASLLLLPILALISNLPCHICTPSKRKFTTIEKQAKLLFILCDFWRHARM